MVNATETEAHLSFLASDEMRGRDTGSPEIDQAANYLATQFRILGVKPVNGTSTFFQQVQLEEIKPPADAVFTIESDLLKLKDDILLINGGAANLDTDVVFIGYGTKEDFDQYPVKDKIVLAYAGTPTTKNAVQALLTDSPAKNKLASAKGAAGLIEIMALPGVPWQAL
ncbi:MAG: peptidase M28, partial [Marivirga sp.]|nr:peptidase M28 [Marivirga sp.]